MKSEEDAYYDLGVIASHSHLEYNAQYEDKQG